MERTVSDRFRIFSKLNFFSHPRIATILMAYCVENFHTQCYPSASRDTDNIHNKRIDISTSPTTNSDI
ncbi:hypothetical protein [Rubritalea tangerina]|uniref:Uncharacterized protein n=1 Tax=Rubritalea tangerina TaxID=430798 RepID=A0ABW4ZFU2_9BACT